ncbi:MAG: thiol peroxidase [Bacteroidales bacterium]
MATVTLKGNPIHTIGELPIVGAHVPEFKVVKTDLSTLQAQDLKGKNVVYNIFPSLDTDVCAASVRKFNASASQLENTTVICVSKDLPFAHKRFCTVEGLTNVVSASDFRDGSFGNNFGVVLTDGPLAGLLARSIVVTDENGKVVYTELVPEIVQEPDYEAALKAL